MLWKDKKKKEGLPSEDEAPLSVRDDEDGKDGSDVAATLVISNRECTGSDESALPAESWGCVLCGISDDERGASPSDDEPKKLSNALPTWYGWSRRHIRTVLAIFIVCVRSENKIHA